MSQRYALLQLPPPPFVLGADRRSTTTQDHDAIDFTDNNITSLANFPLSPRLQTLLLARNRVSQIQGNIANSLPALATLVLTENRIAELADLDALRQCGRLTHLTLLENPVRRKEVRFVSPKRYSV